MYYLRNGYHQRCPAKDSRSRSFAILTSFRHHKMENNLVK